MGESSDGRPQLHNHGQHHQQGQQLPEMSQSTLICLLIVFCCPMAANAMPEDALDIQMAMAGELPREEIALLYQRLKSTGRHGGGRPRNGTGARRNKIVPPVVSAVLRSSTAASSTSTQSSSTSRASTSSSSSPTSQRTSSAKPLPEAAEMPPLWPPSFLQISRVTAIVLVGLFFSLATTIGNALVMLSICVDRKLQTISNYFLFSLAVADLTIGLISIPLMTLYTANQSWSFGYALCQFWLCIDYLMCNASVLNLLLISFDRYFSVTRPLTYRPKRTTRKALFMIAGTYTLSMVLWPPWIVLWPYMEGRFIVEESALCVVQFLALGDYARNWRNQLATVVTAAAAFYIPVTLMIVLYYKVYLETQRRQKELRKLQDGQQLFSPSKLAGTSALHSLMLPLAPLIRGLQATTDQIPSSTFSARETMPVAQPPPAPMPAKQIPGATSRINFMELVSNISTLPAAPSIKKKERFSLLRYCTGKSQQTDGTTSSEDSVMDEAAALEETGGLTTSNLDSILVDQTAVELAQPMEMDRDGLGDLAVRGAKESSAPLGAGNALELGRTSRPPSVHTYNSIVIIEYPEDGKETKRPSVRLSSHAEVESLSARNSVERDGKKPEEKMELSTRAESGSERQKLRLTKSCPGGPPQLPAIAGRPQQNGLMKKSEIQMLREEQMRRSEKERRRNERKQESKAAKTLSAILFAFIITWTPYNVIVIVEAFFPNSVPATLFTLSYFLSYVNSTINPLCYALCNARFRMTYLRILQCKWGRRNSGALSPFEGGFLHGHHAHGQRVLLKGRHRTNAH